MFSFVSSIFPQFCNKIACYHNMEINVCGLNDTIMRTWRNGSDGSGTVNYYYIPRKGELFVIKWVNILKAKINGK